MYEAINFNEKLKKISDHWAAKVIAEMNDYQFKLVKRNIKKTPLRDIKKPCLKHGFLMV